jgi:hypothetical protein
VASSMPGPSRLCSWTTSVARTPQAHSSPARPSETNRESKDCRAADARAYARRAGPTGSAPVFLGRGQLGPGGAGLAHGGSRQVEPLGELGHEAEAGGVVLEMATLPFRVRHGEPVGAAEVDIGQSCDSTRLKVVAHEP